MSAQRPVVERLELEYGTARLDLAGAASAAFPSAPRKRIRFLSGPAYGADVVVDLLPDRVLVRGEEGAYHPILGHPSDYLWVTRPQPGYRGPLLRVGEAAP